MLKCATQSNLNLYNEMARYKGTQASHLYEKLMHTLCTINEQPLPAEASTILDQSLSHTYGHVSLKLIESCIGLFQLQST